MSKKIEKPDNQAERIVVFQERAIRRSWHENAWWFAIVDVVAVLTDSVQPEGYVKDLLRRDKELAKGWGQIATPLRIETGGRSVSIALIPKAYFVSSSPFPLPRRSAFKRWLAKVGYERVKEIENPELASARARDLYQAKLSHSLIHAPERNPRALRRDGAAHRAQ